MKKTYCKKINGLEIEIQLARSLDWKLMLNIMDIFRDDMSSIKYIASYDSPNGNEYHYENGNDETIDLYDQEFSKNPANYLVVCGHHKTLGDMKLVLPRLRRSVFMEIKDTRVSIESIDKYLKELECTALFMKAMRLDLIEE